MTVPKAMASAVARLASVDANERARAAGELSDIARESDRYGAAVSGTLVMVMAIEQDEECYRDQLRCLNELSRHTAIPLPVVEPLRTTMKGFDWEAELVNGIVARSQK